MEPIRQTQVQPILLSKIRPNPQQPRHVITPEMVESMAASLKLAGLKNPVKVRPLTDGQFEIISGHIRAAGARKLDWETLPALVLDLTPEQVLLESILDNRGQEMNWLDLYQSIEILLKADPETNQKKVGDLLEVDQTTVSRASILMNCLNPGSRAKLYEQFVKPEAEQVTQRAVFALTLLKEPEKVEKALKVVLDHHMTEPQAAKLAAWVLQTGKDPGEYPQKREKEGEVDPSDPNSRFWKPLPSYMHVHKTSKGYRAVMDLTFVQGPVAVYGAMAWMENLKAQTNAGAPDPQFNNAWPQLVEGAKQQLEEEKRLQVEAEKHDKLLADEKALAKSQREEERQAAQKAKAEARNAAAALHSLKKTQTQKETQGTIRAMGELVKMKVGENLGPGTLTEMVVRAAHNGQKAKALKLYGDGLAHLGKTEEEQKALLSEIEEPVNQMADLKKQLGVRNSESGTSGSQTSAEKQTPVVANQAEAKGDGIQEQAPAPSPGLLGQVVQEAKDKLKDVTAQGVTDTLVKDAKQAINYQIRKGMRDILKDVF